MSWTDDKIAKLKELWGKGNTASQIAEIIGGISRNAVIGKAHRLNLSSKIKTRNTSSNQNLQNNLEINDSKSGRGKKSKFKSLIIEKDFEPESPKELEELGAGEIFLTSVNRDGLKTGFDIKVTEKVSSKVKIPVIAHGGAGSLEHIYEVIKNTNINGVSFSSIIHYEACNLFPQKKSKIFDRITTWISISTDRWKQCRKNGGEVK